MFRVLVLTVALFLSGCISSGPKRVALSMSSFSYSPVLATEVQVADIYFQNRPSVTLGMADVGLPRSTGHMYLSRPLSGAEDFQISVHWVEMLTNRAWRASVLVDPKELTVEYDNVVSLILIFGANGYFAVGSDDASEYMTKDVVQTCGERVPEEDRDVAAEVNKHAKLASALALDYAPVPDQTICPEPVK
jgi:hypothetical protein